MQSFLIMIKRAPVARVTTSTKQQAAAAAAAAAAPVAPTPPDDDPPPSPAAAGVREDTQRPPLNPAAEPPPPPPPPPAPPPARHNNAEAREALPHLQLFIQETDPCWENASLFGVLESAVSPGKQNRKEADFMRELVEHAAFYVRLLPGVPAGEVLWSGIVPTQTLQLEALQPGQAFLTTFLSTPCLYRSPGGKAAKNNKMHAASMPLYKHLTKSADVTLQEAVRSLEAFVRRAASSVRCIRQTAAAKALVMALAEQASSPDCYINLACADLHQLRVLAKSRLHDAAVARQVQHHWQLCDSLVRSLRVRVLLCCR